MPNIQPAPVRLGPLVVCHSWAPRASRLRDGPPRWRVQFLEGLLAGGLPAACDAAGISLATALAGRVRDSRFRKAWDNANAERLNAMESVLIDQLLKQVNTNGRGTIAPLDKAALSAWQTVRDERRRGLAAVSVPAERRPSRPAAQASLPRPLTTAAVADARDLAQESAEIDALISKVEAGIAAAELALGRAPTAAEPSGKIDQGSSISSSRIKS